MSSKLESRFGQFLFRVGAGIFALSLVAGVARSLARYHALPGVGFEYNSSIRETVRDQGLEAALPQLRTAARIDFDNELAAAQLLQSARQMDDAETILRALLELVRFKPDDPEIRDQLVGALLSQGRVVEAYAHGRVALRLSPDSASAYCNVGAALLGMGRKREAAAAYRKALQLDPGSQSAQLALQFPLRGY
jgi:Flp pilus assembly protein TadD